jgi:hypothetical protein
MAWCSWWRVTAFAGESRAGQLAIAGRLTVGSSLRGRNGFQRHVAQYAAIKCSEA